jgi:tRNA(Leu) C34 or U34 (ribose-2'-O)-methylase TrmL
MSRGFSVVGLHNPKNKNNVGGAMRAASCYGADMVAIAGERYSRQGTDTTGTYKHIPVIITDELKKVIPLGCTPVAIEFIPSGRSLIKYTHPERAFYIFGPEDSSLGDNILEYCRDIVYVPTNYCMNLASTVNVVLYDRIAKGMK